MKSSTVTIILITFLVIIGLFVWGYNQNDNSLAAVQGVESDGLESALIATSTVYDFGSISMANGDVSKDFVFSNPTNKDIVINNVETSCMCTTASFVESGGLIKGFFGMAGMGYENNTNEVIKSGETKIVRVTYDPNAHGPAGVGLIDRFIRLTDSTGGNLQFEIKAVVTP